MPTCWANSTHRQRKTGKMPRDFNQMSIYAGWAPPWNIYQPCVCSSWMSHLCTIMQWGRLRVIPAGTGEHSTVHMPHIFILKTAFQTPWTPSQQSSSEFTLKRTDSPFHQVQSSWPVIQVMISQCGGCSYHQPRQNESKQSENHVCIIRECYSTVYWC